MNINISNILKKFLLNCVFKIKNIKNNKKEFEILKSFYYKQVINLTELNNINYYKESNSYYINILKIFENLKHTIENNFKTSKTYKLLILKKEALLNLNFLGVKRIKTNLFFIDNKFESYFTIKEIEMLNFLNDFVRITSIWISDVHVEENEDENKNNKNKIILVPSNNTFNNTNTFFKSMFINSILNQPDVSQETFVDNDNEENTVTNLFTKMEIIKELGDKKIVIHKNKKATSLIDNKVGTTIFIKLGDKFIACQGIFIDDLFNLSLNYSFIKNILNNHNDYLLRDLTNIPSHFKFNYFEVFNLRDKIIL